MKSRVALVLLSGTLVFGGVACGNGSSSEAACAEWKTSYTSDYVRDSQGSPYVLGDESGHWEKRPTGQTCVRWSNGSSATPTTRTMTTTTNESVEVQVQDNAAIQAACKAEEEAYGRSVDADEAQYTRQAWMECLTGSH